MRGSGRAESVGTSRDDKRRERTRIRQRLWYKRNREKKIASVRTYRRAQSRRALAEIGVCQTYEELASILAKRRRTLDLTQLELDDIAGLQDGYTGKLEIGTTERTHGKRASGRMAGPVSLYLWLASLKVELVVRERTE